MPEHYDKLSKKDLERHFPNKSHGGKGSNRRISTPESRQRFKDNFDKIKWGTIKN